MYTWKHNTELFCFNLSMVLLVCRHGIGSIGHWHPLTVCLLEHDCSPSIFGFIGGHFECFALVIVLQVWVFRQSLLDAVPFRFVFNMQMPIITSDRYGAVRTESLWVILPRHVTIPTHVAAHGYILVYASL